MSQEESFQSAFDTMLATWQRITLRNIEAALTGVQVGATSSLKKTGGRTVSLAGSRKLGVKRAREEIATLTEALAAYIEMNPGQRIEQIGMALQIPTRDLALPVKKLIATKR